MKLTSLTEAFEHLASNQGFLATMSCESEVYLLLFIHSLTALLFP